MLLVLEGAAIRGPCRPPRASPSRDPQGAESPPRPWGRGRLLVLELCTRVRDSLQPHLFPPGSPEAPRTLRPSLPQARAFLLGPAPSHWLALATPGAQHDLTRGPGSSFSPGHAAPLWPPQYPCPPCLPGPHLHHGSRVPALFLPWRLRGGHVCQTGTRKLPFAIPSGILEGPCSLQLCSNTLQQVPGTIPEHECTLGAPG